jgi:pimeloyl-ACP methyl ester carboxylesterase
MRALALPTLAQLSPAAHARRERRALRRDPYGLHPTVIEVDGRPIRSLSAGDIHDHPEVILLAGLGAPGYLAPWARESSQWTRASIVDLPGWRAGHAQACPPTLVAMAMTLAHWLEATERHDVILLGHSTGAQAVLKTAQLVPELIRGLVLAGPTLDPDARTMPALLRRAIRTLPHEVPAELPAAAMRPPSSRRQTTTDTIDDVPAAPVGRSRRGRLSMSRVWPSSWWPRRGRRGLSWSARMGCFLS